MYVKIDNWFVSTIKTYFHVYVLVPIGKSFIHVRWLPTHVRASFYIQVFFFIFCLCNTKILVIPIRKMIRTCMARDCVATIYIWLFVYRFAFWVCLYECCCIARGSFLHSCVSGYYENIHTRMGTRVGKHRTCSENLRMTGHVWSLGAIVFVHVWSLFSWPDMYGYAMQMRSYVSGHLCWLTRCIWFHDASAFVRVCFFFSTDQTRMVTQRNFWPEWESRLIVSTYSRFARDWIDLRTRKMGPCSIHV